MALRRFHSEQPEGFEFLAATEPKIEFWLNKYPQGKQRSAVIPMLWLAQKDNGGWLSEPAMREVADRLSMPYIRVYEVATFYTMFRLQPVGEHHIQLCGTTPCMLRGANDLKTVCDEVIGPKFSVSDDGKLSWEEVECLGACANAPMVQINDYYYEDLSPSKLKEILESLRTGKDIPPGTFIDRQTSAPEGGTEALTDKSLYDGSLAKPLNVIPNAPNSTPVEVSKKETKTKGAAGVAQRAGEEAEKRGDPVKGEEGEITGCRPETLEAAMDGKTDDLKKLKGVGPGIEAKLNGLGIFHFRQIAKWNADNIEWMDGYLSFKGRIARDDWVSQAKILAEGGETEFSKRGSKSSKKG